VDDVAKRSDSPVFCETEDLGVNGCEEDSTLYASKGSPISRNEVEDVVLCTSKDRPLFEDGLSADAWTNIPLTKVDSSSDTNGGDTWSDPWIETDQERECRVRSERESGLDRRLRLQVGAKREEQEYHNEVARLTHTVGLPHALFTEYAVKMQLDAEQQRIYQAERQRSLERFYSVYREGLRQGRKAPSVIWDEMDKSGI